MERFKPNNQRGFTLVEMLVSMSIFVIFTGILINSYASIVRAQQEANDFRVMYTEARRVFDSLVLEFRDGMVDYGHVDYGRGELLVEDLGLTQPVLHLVSKDGEKRNIEYLEERVWVDGLALNSEEVRLADFRVSVSPQVDPYSDTHVGEDAFQFQPSVTVFASFEKDRQGRDPYVVDFQTTISSRIYNQVYVPE